MEDLDYIQKMVDTIADCAPSATKSDEEAEEGVAEEEQLTMKVEKWNASSLP